MTVAKKGGKTKHLKRSSENNVKRQLEKKEEGQEYGKVIKMLGNNRLEILLCDGTTRLGHIRGKMIKKIWITAGDIILVSLREYQENKVDVIHKYTVDEARVLKLEGELPDSVCINETSQVATDDVECVFEFDDI